MAKHYDGLKIRKLRKHNIILKKELWAGLQHQPPDGIHHARFMRPTCQALPLRTFLSPSLLLSLCRGISGIAALHVKTELLLLKFELRPFRTC